MSIMQEMLWVLILSHVPKFNVSRLVELLCYKGNCLFEQSNFNA
jgi:hypothetical protein